MPDSLEKVVKRLKNNPSYKDFSEETLISIAEQEIREDEKVDYLDVGSLFTQKAEIKLGKELVRKYLEDYNIETESDKNLLKQLIYIEVIHTLVLQKSANESKDGDKGFMSTFALDALHKNLEKIMFLKEKLGLTKDTKRNEANDAYAALEKLKKKFKVWAEENQGSRTLTCPYCGKMTLLKIRMDAWEAQKHPFFKDRIICSKHLIHMYKEGKITKEDVAKVLEVSTDYIDWVISKINLENY